MTTLEDYPIYRQEGWKAADDASSAIPYLLLTLLFTATVFCFEFLLDLRQYGRFSKNNGIPKELKDHVSNETFTKSIAYRKDQFGFRITESLFSFCLGLIMMLGGYMPFLWDTATSIALKYGLVSEVSSAFYRESLITWLFVALMSVLDLVTSLPFSLYSTFVVEERHGFNKSTLALFFQDKALTVLLSLGIMAPIMPALVWIVRAGGEYFYFYVWVFLCVVSIVLMTIYPTLIAPLFNKYTKLEDGKEKQAIEELARSVDFPLTNIFSVDGSRRSAHSNAYFYGFFKVRNMYLSLFECLACY